jgi:pimeloyl-ACP methyl ester carboxylesterase
MTTTSRPGTASSYTHTPTQAVDVNGSPFAYRQLGPNTGTPVILLNHLAANLDNWDPRVVDGIAARHRVITSTTRASGHREA